MYERELILPDYTRNNSTFMYIRIYTYNENEERERERARQTIIRGANTDQTAHRKLLNNRCVYMIV